MGTSTKRREFTDGCGVVCRVTQFRGHLNGVELSTIPTVTQAMGEVLMDRRFHVGERFHLSQVSDRFDGNAVVQVVQGDGEQCRVGFTVEGPLRVDGIDATTLMD